MNRIGTSTFHSRDDLAEMLVEMQKQVDQTPNEIQCVLLGLGVAKQLLLHFAKDKVISVRQKPSTPCLSIRRSVDLSICRSMYSPSAL